MRVFIYTRVSSEEQARHGLSLDAQETALKEWCSNAGYEVAGIYKDEGISGRKPYTKRPELVRLLGEIESKKPGLIIFTKLDRWFRNISEYYKVQEILEKHNVDWKAIWEGYDTSTSSGRLHVNIMLSVAQDEADRTSERIKQIQANQVARGLAISGSQPMGFKVELINGQKKVVKDPVESEMVMDMINHYEKYQSTNELARYMNNKYDRTMSRLNYNRLLKNSLLCGEYRGNPAYCDGYITRDRFNNIQSMLNNNIRARYNNRIYLFSGLIRCPFCGNVMAGVADPLLNGGVTKRYRCAKHYAGLCEMNFHVREDMIENYLLDNIQKELNNFTVKYTEQKHIQKHIDNSRKYEGQLSRLNEMYLLGNICHDDYVSKTDELKNAIEMASKPSDKSVENLNIALKDFKSNYLLLDDKHKQAFWRGIIKSVELTKGNKVDHIIFLA